MQVKIPDIIRQKCEGPPLPAGDKITVGDIAAFSVLQEAAIQQCDIRREVAVSVLDAVNEVNKPAPKPWWRVW